MPLFYCAIYKPGKTLGLKTITKAAASLGLYPAQVGCIGD